MSEVEDGNDGFGVKSCEIIFSKDENGQSLQCVEHILPTVINFCDLFRFDMAQEERQSNEVWIENTILDISDTLFGNWIILK